MRVLYDGVIYRIQKHGGVVRYFNGLIHNLPASITPILLAPNQPAVAPRHPNLSLFIESCQTLFWPIKPLRKSIIARRFYNRVASESPDVIHPTYYYSSLRHLNQKVTVPTVLTVYDMIHERFPEEMDPNGKQIRLKKQAVDRADAIICISESTKLDLQHFYSIPDERIRVIYPGREFESGKRSNVDEAAKDVSEKPYLLYVGERNFYKNFERSLEAFAKVASVHSEIDFLCVGGRPFSRSENQLMAELRVADKVQRKESLSDLEMQAVYKGATALVYPSLYEGFGIPIVEAMASGTVVLTSNCASMPEVAGDAAILFDPYSVDEIADSMLSAVEETEKRNGLIEQGRKRAQQFSFSHSATETVEVYQSVARRSGAAA